MAKKRGKGRGRKAGKRKAGRGAARKTAKRAARRTGGKKRAKKAARRTGGQRPAARSSTRRPAARRPMDVGTRSDVGGMQSGRDRSMSEFGILPPEDENPPQA